MLFCSDILNELFKYIKIVDIYNLSLISNYYHNIIKIEQNIINEINLRLYKIFGEDLYKFKELLKNVNGFISGSFIIQCILGNEFIISDIDIYFPTSKKNITDKEYPNSDIDIFHNFIYKYLPVSYEASIYGDVNVGCVTDYFKYEYGHKKLDNVNIQLIEFEGSSNLKFINNNFDFNVCKNIYDGNNLIIKNIYNICNKIIDLKDILCTEEVNVRYMKYKSRGFTFINENLMKLKDITIYEEKNIPINIIIEYPHRIDSYCSINCIFNLIFGNHKHILRYKNPSVYSEHRYDKPDVSYLLLTEKKL
jgi:hypothetical protein